MTSFTLVVITLALFALVASAAYRPKPEKRPTYQAREEQLDGLPDHGDPAVRVQLECSACKALVSQLYDDLSKLYDLRHSRPKHYEVVEVTEHMCARVRDSYGLLMRNNMATNEFSRDEAITRMKGSWINSFIEGRCGEILSHYEEPIIENFPRLRNKLKDFQKLVCYKLDKKCAAAEYTHHDEL
jgi:hypothetical protein